MKQTNILHILSQRPSCIEYMSVNSRPIHSSGPRNSSSTTASLLKLLWPWWSCVWLPNPRSTPVHLTCSPGWTLSSFWELSPYLTPVIQYSTHSFDIVCYSFVGDFSWIPFPLLPFKVLKAFPRVLFWHAFTFSSLEWYLSWIWVMFSF